MPRQRKTFTLTLATNVQEIYLLMLDAKEPDWRFVEDDGKWVARFASFRVDADGDLDLGLIVFGPAGRPTSLSVKFTGKKAKKLTTTFNSSGVAIFNKAIVYADLVDE